MPLFSFLMPSSPLGYPRLYRSNNVNLAIGGITYYLTRRQERSRDRRCLAETERLVREWMENEAALSTCFL
jgi:hypothetical protein